jgi:hypothetical protein
VRASGSASRFSAAQAVMIIVETLLWLAELVPSGFGDGAYSPT